MFLKKDCRRKVYWRAQYDNDNIYWHYITVPGVFLMINEYIKVMKLNSEKYLIFDGDSLKMYIIPEEEFRNVEKYLCTPKPRRFTELGTINRLSRLTLCISGVCNLACRYCYEGNQNSVNSYKGMSRETVQRTIDFIYREYSEGVNCIQFFGGEPLLFVDIMEYAIKLVCNHCQKLSVKLPYFTIVTNGTLINDKVHEIFNKYFKRITISLDGRRATNDANRIFANQTGSVYDRVCSNLKKYQNKRQYRIDVQMTITEEQLSGKDTDISDYLHIKDLGVDSIHITPVINTNRFKVEERREYTECITNYFRKCYEVEMRDINETNYSKLLSLVNILKTKKSSDHFCGAGFLDVSIDVDGNIYPCFMFNDNSKFIMGNVYDENSEAFLHKREDYINNRISKNDDCANCWAHGICSSGHSGCIGAFYLENGSINTPVMYNCAITKSVFENVLCKIAEYLPN